jgi:heptosyltransferase II
VGRLLVIAPNWLGDAVMALPALADIRRHFAEATLAVAARATVAPLFDCVPGIDQLIVLEGYGDSSGPGGRRDAVARVAEGRFDAAILFPNSFRAAWLVRSAGVPERWGYSADFRRVLLTRSVRRPGRVHYAAYCQRLASELGIANGPLEARLSAPASLRASAEEQLRSEGWTPGQPLLGIAPGAAYGHAKRWPPARFAELFRLVWERTDATCVVLGRAADRDARQDILDALDRAPGGRPSGRLIDLTGRSDLLQLIGVASCCRAFVANDSGALHLAAALGVPVVGIYGPTDERYTSPLAAGPDLERQVRVLTAEAWCRPCGLRECPIDHRCMRRVSALQVFEALGGALGGRAEGS